MQTICYGCFREKQSAPVCEHCGHSEDSRNLPHQLPQGAVLARQYLIGRVLGQGGFGITYLGLDQKLNRKVAIKEFFPSGLVGRDSTVSHTVTSTSGGDRFLKGRERFLREARLLARLEDLPEIARVHDLFTANDTAYIIMEYVDGQTLQQYVRRRGGNLLAVEVLDILQPVMQGLSHVHAAGLIHRDISPDNIMIRSDGAIKLLDFGTARDVDTRNHSTQAVMKHGYAPIEQYQSTSPMGPWTDVYALCATAWYCLTGSTPPEAPAMLMDGEQIPWEQIPGLTEQQRRALARGTALNAADRYQSVDALYRGLYLGEEVPESPPAPKAPQPKPGKKRLLPAAALAAAAAAVLAGAWMLLPKQEPALAVPEATAPVTQALAETLPPETDPPQTTQDPKLWLNNVMMEDDIGYFPYDNFSGAYDPAKYQRKETITANATVFGSDLLRRQVLSITVLNTLADAPADAWDISQAGDGSVLAWAVQVPPERQEEFRWVDDQGLVGYDLFLAGEGGILAPENCRGLFGGYRNSNRIDFGGHFHTDFTTDMSHMFQDSSSYGTMDLTAFRTEQVTDMRYMFAYSYFSTLDISGFETPVLENIHGMFQSNMVGSSVSRIIGAGDLDISLVQDMGSVFAGALYEQLDLSQWDTSSATDMSYLFAFMSNLSHLDLSNWNTEQVTTMAHMFSSCESLAQLDVSSLDTGKVTDMSSMFSSCKSLGYLDLSTFDTSSVRTMKQMFCLSSNLTMVDLTGFDTTNVTNMSEMFAWCSSLSPQSKMDFIIQPGTDRTSMYYETSLN